MKGLELSRRYFSEAGLPMLERDFPEYLPRLAAGLAGEGSECLGYDDELSRDHDFGPSFCLWLTSEDYVVFGARLQRAYDALPGGFLGFPARRTSHRSGGRVGVLEISAFYSLFIGAEQPPCSPLRWLYLPEDKLAAVTSGEVFMDGPGEFSAIRSALAAYYPEDVRVKKIAARAAAMAQSGQYNYARCMRRGDGAAASLAQAEFLKNALSMLHLLNRKYLPYYKWMFRSARELPILSGAVPLLAALAGAPEQSAAWSGPLPDNYVNRADAKAALIEEVCALVAAELRRQGLSGSMDDFLEAHTGDIMSRIADPELRARHVLEG